jgi:hypothetical protein
MTDFNLELSLEQQLEIERLKRTLTKLSREDLEKEVISFAKLYFGYLNAFKSVCKKNIL